MEALRAQAGHVLGRFDAAPLTPLPPPPPNPADVLAWAARARAAVSDVLGETLPVLPVLRLAGTRAGEALTAARPDGADDDALADWLRDMENVRPRARGLGDALTASEALSGTAPCGAAVAQLPSGERWIARGPAPAPSRANPAPRQSVVLRTDGRPDPGQVAGLVVESWTENVPEAARTPQADGAARPPEEEIGGLSFHFNQPDARAPQAWLLAVPPDALRGWRMEDLHAVIEETFSLARVRGMDLTDFPELRGVLPVQWTSPPKGWGLRT
jgi:hypothetical protein